MSGVIDSVRTVTSKAQLQTFFERATTYAKLIYDVNGQLPCSIRVTHTNCRDLQRLKQLKPDDVFVISDPALARGIDYRAAPGSKGIALLVMSACESERAYV